MVDSQELELQSSEQRAAKSAVVWVAIIAFTLMCWYAAPVLLLTFAGVLGATFLRTAAEAVSRWTGMRVGVALLLVVVVLAGLMIVAVWLLGPRILDEAERFRTSLPQAVDSLRQRVPDGTVSQIQNSTGPQELLPGQQQLVSRALGFFSTAFGAVASLVYLLFVSIYLAVEPRTYRRGLLALVPGPNRQRANDLVSDVGTTLKWWILGKLLSMLVVGVLTAIGLYVLGIPLALTLALLASALTFIPNVGPILSAVPAILMALMRSPELALWVVGLYLAVQTLESYVITPFIQRRTVSMPAGLILFSQLLMGVLLGALGVALATPLMAVIIVIVRKAYLENEK